MTTEVEVHVNVHVHDGVGLKLAHDAGLAHDPDVVGDQERT